MLLKEQKSKTLQTHNALIHINEYGLDSDTLILTLIDTKEDKSFSLWTTKEEMDALVKLLLSIQQNE